MNRNQGRWLLGLAIIAVGVIWLLNNLDLTDIPVGTYIWRLWPVVLVYFGAVTLADALRRRSPPAPGLLFGGGVLLIGLWILAANFGLVGFRAGQLWGVILSLVLVGLGLSLIRGRSLTAGGNTHWAIMSGVDLGRTPFDLGDLSLVAFMGGGRIDLSRARITADEVTLDCYAVMGGFDILVPPDMRLVCDASAILGGVEVFGESTGGVVAQRSFSYTAGEGPLVRVNVRTIMGGVKIAGGRRG